MNWTDSGFKLHYNFVYDLVERKKIMPPDQMIECLDGLEKSIRDTSPFMNTSSLIINHMREFKDIPVIRDHTEFVGDLTQEERDEAMRRIVIWLRWRREELRNSNP